MNLRQPPLVSTKLRQAPRHESCVNCGKADGSVVLCHHNLPGAFGMGLKIDDWWGAHLCSSPNEYHDGGCHGYGDSEGRHDEAWWSLQIFRTQKRLFGMGLLKVA